MNDKYIEIINYKERTRVIPIKTDSWVFRPVSDTKWIQKKLWSLLKWLGAVKRFYDSREVYERIVIDKTDIVEYLDSIYRNYYRRYNRYPTKFYIGSEDFDEIIGNRKLNLTGIVSFDIKDAYRESYYDDFRTFHTVYGISVYVVPHMKGILAI